MEAELTSPVSSAELERTLKWFKKDKSPGPNGWTHISPEQFAFLENRQIHEAIGMAQEAIHSIQSNKLKGIILTIDLAKAFDHVSWLYIKMLLMHLGFCHSFITWIMACITSTTFSVLINGYASHVFHAERGLRQGCPLSPLLFLIVMEGLI
eukprot:PITA_33689